MDTYRNHVEEEVKVKTHTYSSIGKTYQQHRIDVYIRERPNGTNKQCYNVLIETGERSLCSKTYATYIHTSMCYFLHIFGLAGCQTKVGLPAVKKDMGHRPLSDTNYGVSMSV